MRTTNWNREVNVRNRVARRRILGIGLLGASALAVGCVTVPGSGAAVTGSGPVVTEDRQVESFDKVESRNGLQIVITIGETQSVKVSAQQNIVPLISTTVSDGKLTATLTGSVIGATPMRVEIVIPSVTALTLRDGTSVTVTGIDEDTFTLDADNGANANLSGTTASLVLSANNGALLQLSNLVATDATVTLSNGVTGQIHVTGTASGTASDGVLLSIVGGGANGISTSGGAIITSQ